MRVSSRSGKPPHVCDKLDVVGSKQGQEIVNRLVGMPDRPNPKSLCCHDLTLIQQALPRQPSNNPKNQGIYAGSDSFAIRT
jgi:hypothetical protein